jgi:hypothetical protein
VGTKSTKPAIKAAPKAAALPTGIKVALKVLALASAKKSEAAPAKTTAATKRKATTQKTLAKTTTTTDTSSSSSVKRMKVDTESKHQNSSKPSDESEKQAIAALNTIRTAPFTKKGGNFTTTSSSKNPAIAVPYIPPVEGYHYPHPAAGGWPYYSYPYGYPYHPHYAAGGAYPYNPQGYPSGHAVEVGKPSTAVNKNSVADTSKVPAKRSAQPTNASQKPPSAVSAKSNIKASVAKSSTNEKDNKQSKKAETPKDGPKGEPSFVPFQSDRDASRLAVEKLIDGSGEGEWSLMSAKMKSMIHADGDGVGTSGATLSRFPIDFEASNLSGLSMLNEASKHATELAEDDRQGKESSSASNGQSIMARVLENASKSTLGKFPSPAKVTKKTNKTAAAASLPPPASTEPSFRTPQKNTTRRGGFFATAETPMGFTSPPAFQSPHGFQSPNGLLRAGAGLSTNLSMPYSPTNSTVMGIFDEKANNDSRFLHELNLSRDANHDNANSPEQGGGGSAGGVGGGLSQPDSVIGDGFQNSNSLLIPPDAFEAVSALGALSNSPFRHAVSSSQTSQSPSEKEKKSQATKTTGDDGEEKGEKDPATTAGGGGTGPPRQSLFARVIGGIPSSNNNKSSSDDKERSPKKKLKF